MFLGIVASVLRARALDVRIAVVGPLPRIQDALVRATADVVDEEHGRPIVVIPVGMEGEAERIAQAADVHLHAGLPGAAGISVVAFGVAAAEDGAAVSILGGVGIVGRDFAVGRQADDLTEEGIGGLLQGQALVVLHLVAQTIAERKIQHAIGSEGNVTAIVIVRHLHGRLQQYLLVVHVQLQCTLDHAARITPERKSAEDIDRTGRRRQFIDLPLAGEAIAPPDCRVVRIYPHTVVALRAGLNIEIGMERDSHQAAGTIVAHEPG